MLEWSPVISPATLITGSLAIVGFVGWVFSLGSKTQEIKAAANDIKRIEERLNTFKQNREAERELDRKEREAFQVAINAGVNAMRGHHAEFREEVAKQYATKHEMQELERRTNQGMDRIVDRLEQISTRLETIGDAIIKTLATRS
jgi:biopolymer transport protein ExbB/TolQ